MNLDNIIIIPKHTARSRLNLDIMEAINVNAYKDMNTNEELTHEQVYNHLIDYLGGPNEIEPYIPFTKEEIQKAYNTNKNLNNLKLQKWSTAAGFEQEAQGKMVLHPNKFWNFLRINGINKASCSQLVCLLKHAAVKLYIPEKS